MFMRTGRFSKPRSVSGYLVYVTLKNIKLILKMETKTFKKIIQGEEERYFSKMGDRGDVRILFVSQLTD